jgi:dihydrofolate synthase/folylpolyglutamate synthase
MFTYEETIAFLNQFADTSPAPTQKLAQRLDLQRVVNLLEKLGSPHRRFRSVHIAGTKGKGSVAALCASVLQAAGYRIGLFTSPHLHEYGERIQVNGEHIPRSTVVELVDAMRPLVAAMPLVTTFELTTALAFTYFARQKVDGAVLEVGLGGRLDATNVVQPEVAIITPVSYDHMHLLGNTLTEIAGEKGGIIKPGVPVVVAPQPAEALETLSRIAADQHAPLVLVGRDWNCRPLMHSLDGQTFEVWRAGGAPVTLSTSLLGAHQAENGAVVCAALAVLREGGWTIAPEAVAEGFRAARWPGRFEVLGRRPFVVVDGAHNRDSAVRLAAAVRDYLPGRRVILVFGAAHHKDVAGMFAELLPGAALPVAAVILTEAETTRAWDAEDLARLAAAAAPDVPRSVVSPAARGLEKALELSTRGM